jgi:hypothetical protein
VIWIPPGEKHWHGAMATTAMTQIAIQEQLDGKAADWMERSATNNIVRDWPSQRNQFTILPKEMELILR